MTEAELRKQVFKIKELLVEASTLASDAELYQTMHAINQSSFALGFEAGDKIEIERSG